MIYNDNIATLGTPGAARWKLGLLAALALFSLELAVAPHFALPECSGIAVSDCSFCLHLLGKKQTGSQSTAISSSFISMSWSALGHEVRLAASSFQLWSIATGIRVMAAKAGAARIVQITEFDCSFWANSRGQIQSSR